MLWRRVHPARKKNAGKGPTLPPTTTPPGETASCSDRCHDRGFAHCCGCCCYDEMGSWWWCCCCSLFFSSNNAIDCSVREIIGQNLKFVFFNDLHPVTTHRNARRTDQSHKVAGRRLLQCGQYCISVCCVSLWSLTNSRRTININDND